MGAFFSEPEKSFVTDDHHLLNRFGVASEVEPAGELVVDSGAGVGVVTGGGSTAVTTGAAAGASAGTATGGELAESPEENQDDTVLQPLPERSRPRLRAVSRNVSVQRRGERELAPSRASRDAACAPRE